MFQLLKETVFYVIGTLIHNAPILIFGIFVAAAITVYVDPEKMKRLLLKKSRASIVGSVGLGAFTPFCACGTMAVIVSMMTTALPWAPIMAFLTSSPLMSPDEFILYSGIVSLNFALALTAASVVIGLGSGVLTHFIEKNTRFFENQARIDNQQVVGCCSNEENASGCKTVTQLDIRPPSFVKKYQLKRLAEVFYEVGVKKVLIYFTLFAAVGFLINKFVPSSLIMQYVGSGNGFAVPVMAVIGLPLYVNGSSSIPIVNALIAGGASQGALLAFMITGPGTSAGVIAGLLTIMKKKAIALYVTYLLIFAVILGYLYDYLLLWVL